MLKFRRIWAWLRDAVRRRLNLPVSVRKAHAPIILQMEAVECGAASLAMILAHYGKYVPLEQLRIACGVSRDGSKALNVVRAARGFGLEALGQRKEPAELRNMPLPMVAFWNFNHFLVIDGFADGQVLLNDPALGRRVVSDAEFDASFTGIVLTFRPGAAFCPSGTPPSILASLRSRLTGVRQALAYLVLAGIALVLPSMVIPAFTSIFIDRILVGGLHIWLMPLVAGMVATAGLLGALTWLQRYYLLKLEMRMALTSTARFFWHALRLPVGFYQQRSPGDIGARVGLNDRVANVMSADVAAAALSLLTAALFALALMFYDVLMSSVTLAMMALNVLLLQAVGLRRREQNQRLSIDRGKVAGTSMNGLLAMESLKASGTESDFFGRWAGYQARLANSTRTMSQTSIALTLVPRWMTAMNTAVLLGLGGARVISGDMTIGALVAFLALVASFVGPVNTLVGLGGKVQGLQGDMDRLDDVLRYPAEEWPSGDSETVPLQTAKLEGGLELRNVTFGYSRLEPPLLENFNLVLKPGQRIALVGSSGCGKSTISKLVAGLFQPWSGEVLFDGRPREAWPRRQLLNSVATVDQEIALFCGTIRDNLTMWDETILHRIMIEAARDACVHDIVSARPGGYDSLVAEGGANFSGGQRQRLEIARALTANPRLLVLDEATSALDPVTEQIVDANVRRRGCSCLIVAHRLSAIRDCDEIILLDKGKVAERGSHEELMKLNGRYARLIANE